MSESAAADTRFWDRSAPKYSKRPVRDETAYRATLERVRSRLHAGQRVLELGCGTGSTALELAPSTGDYLATDASPAMIAIAREKAATRGINQLRFATGRLEDAEPSEPYDVVMAFNLLHLLSDIRRAFQRVHALLQPGGLFISKTPCIGEYNLLLRGLIPLLRAFGKAPFVNQVTEAALKSSFAESGFEILETGLYPPKTRSFFVVAQRAW